MLKTITKAELVAELSFYDPEQTPVVASNAGDHSNTPQAIFIGELSEGFLVESTYAASGYMVVESGDENDDSQPVAFFKPMLNKDFALNVEEMLEQLEGYEDDDLIVASCDFGDSESSLEAVELSTCQEVYLNESDYCESGFEVVEEGDEDDAEQDAVILNYDFL
jgi:hypothetical protein